MFISKIKRMMVLLLMTLFVPTALYAQGFSIRNPLNGVNSIEALVARILQFVVRVGTIVAVFAIIWVGFLFIRAQGKPEEIAKARAAFFWVVVGSLILIGADALADVICNTAQQLGASAQCS